MSVQRFLKLEEALELFNSLESDESDVEIAALPPDASELTDEDEGDENEGFRATGTIRENRTNHECPLEESKSMQKKERGTSDFAFDEKSEIFLVRWNDNSVVSGATNFSTLEPFFDEKRRVRGHKDKVNVKMPTRKCSRKVGSRRGRP
ncbi:piggyBac transposable element-derived protein 2-like [Stegodyphus dumicola]|uniref:piggyBac transposable element-derived protein 2-like n=1 Tax=Stegodyphus dumicola TaxID=202533 RepID=UPI0015B31938|nr:piggyBac transposable element-derived protein 2-like [Stegodyphus dumicola]